MLTVLGISLGTRTIGIAMVRHQQLIDYRVKTFKGKWTKGKLDHIVAVLEDIIITQGVTYIAFKIPPLNRRSDALETLKETLIELAKNHKISIKSFDIHDIKKFCKNQPNREGIIQFLSEKHAQLYRELCKENKNRNGYYIKLFEAVGVAFMVL